MVRGALYWSALVISVFLLLTLSEFRAFFKPEFKIPLVTLFGLMTIVSAYTWIGAPLMSFMKLGKRISHEQAASIIGAHFPNVQDKLLNILQLRNDAASASSVELIEASINQKSAEIKLVPFVNAIDLGGNRKYLKYALPPLMVLLILFFGSPNIIRDSAQRLANPGQHFEKVAPFHFEVSSPDKVVQYEDAEIEVRIKGQLLPSEVFVNKEGKEYKMVAKQKDLFSYTFKNIPSGFDFFVDAEGYSSIPHHIDIIPKPTLLDAQVDLRYPAYTGKRPEVLRSVGELTIPIGTHATWKFNTRNTSSFSVLSEDGKEIELDSQSGLFEFASRQYTNQHVTFYLSNEELAKADSVSYTVNIIPDQYPSIRADKITDTINTSFMYFVGEFSDDYGISDLRFHFKLNRYDTDQADSLGAENLQFERNASIGRFSHYTNADLYPLLPGDQLEFYFEVKDNDGINGAKSSRSTVFIYKKPTVEEFKDLEADNNEAIKDELEEAIDKVEEFAKDVEALKEDVLEKKALSWEEKKKLEDLMKQHDDLNDALEKMQQTFEENMKNQEEFKEVDKEILEKQKRIEELMEEVLTEEMKEMMDKIREMMEDLDMSEMFDDLEDFEMSNEELEMQLDRMLELFKKLEFEQKMQDMINELEELAEEQLELSKESLEEDADSEEILEKQEALNEKFEEMQNDMSELEELNKEQKSPADLGDMDEQSEEISEEMQEGSEQLEQQKPKKSQPIAAKGWAEDERNGSTDGQPDELNGDDAGQ